MKKQGLILVIATLMAVILCGAASAADSSTIGGEGDISDVNSSEEADPILWVNVTYEYNDTINPEITVTDSDNNSVAFNKTLDSGTLYKLNFTYPGVTNGTVFNVMVKAPGYITQIKQVTVNQSGTDPFVGNADFNMQATENYKLGREITKAADDLLDFDNADDVLCITTAGLVYRNGTTTEDCLEGILNGSHGEISYGQGNLLTFNSIRTDPLDFCFIVRNGSLLTAAFFKNGTLIPTYFGTFSAIDQTLWDNTLKPALGDNAFGYVSIAHAWKEGLSTDILRQAAYHGHVCLGTISGQAMVSLLLKYFPPGVYGDDGELEATSYRAIGVPGNSDDDAFGYSLDLTPGKRSYVGYFTEEDSVVGFIRWCASTNLGTLIIMKFNEDVVTQLFKQETGITAYSGIAAELLFNSWLIDKLENDPDSLVDIILVYENITPEIHNNLTGGVDSKNVVADALGLDMDYILSQGFINVADQITATNYETGNLTPEQIKDIGINAANMAIALFAADGITLEMDSSKLTVFTSAGYVRVNGQVVDLTMDGLYQILGTRLSRATLLPVHNARYNQLYFQFSFENPNGTVTTKTIYYDPETGNLIAKNESACNIEQVILYDPPYDALMAWLWHNHVCGGSAPGYYITNYIYENFPIGENESYAYIGTSISCRDDIYSYLLGISPGEGSYLSQRMTSDSTGKTIGILSIYDSETDTTRIIVIEYNGPKFKDGSNIYEEWIKIYKGDYSSENLLSPPSVNKLQDTYTNGHTNWNNLGSSSNSIEDAMSLPKRSKADVIRIRGGSQTGSNTGSLISSNGSGTGLHGFSNGSLNGSGVNVSAASVTNATTSSVGESGKSYEVTKAGSEGSGDTPWSLYALLGVITVLVLGAVGFFFKGSLFGE
ncbi:FmdE family protein [Methanobacterium formicicum]|uniref:FmdE family protein n=1 Tax=Methanobacterium formicicum TaxID=2162 RepID=UPI0024124A9E|nr:FmdE family protein [Methanobacterium formicicum]MDG3546383.1 FmdE family protein [Methanobacterium formicicum]